MHACISCTYPAPHPGVGIATAKLLYRAVWHVQFPPSLHHHLVQVLPHLHLLLLLTAQAHRALFMELSSRINGLLFRNDIGRVKNISRRLYFMHGVCSCLHGWLRLSSRRWWCRLHCFCCSICIKENCYSCVITPYEILCCVSSPKEGKIKGIVGGYAKLIIYASQYVERCTNHLKQWGL